jgi:ribonuclease HI
MTSSDEITCYTDGSHCDNRSGAGVFSDTLKLEESYSLGTYTTVFQAEVYAILACSDICQKARLQNETIHILSDSKAALMARSSYKISSSIVMQCWNSLQALSTSNRVRLSWVPGHCDIAGNEMADKLARAGSAAIFCGPEPALRTFRIHYSADDEPMGRKCSSEILEFSIKLSSDKAVAS